jgi:AcrR family transcriptional regulator
VIVEDGGKRHRLRLLEGMTTAVARKGYAAVTIADVVAEAGVSKRTFYEHFDGKEDCLLACYVEASSTLMAAIRQQLIAAQGDDSSLIRSVLEVYLRFLDQAPQMAATLLIEVQRAGPRGRRIYRQANLEFIRLIRDSLSGAGLGLAPLELSQSIALVGGVNELVLTHAEDNPGASFQTLGPAVFRFIEAVLGRAGSRFEPSEPSEHSDQERSSRRVSR